jgi:hypothetical protein
LTAQSIANVTGHIGARGRTGIAEGPGPRRRRAPPRTIATDLPEHCP